MSHCIIGRLQTHTHGHNPCPNRNENTCLYCIKKLSRQLRLLSNACLHRCMRRSRCQEVLSCPIRSFLEGYTSHGHHCRAAMGLVYVLSAFPSSRDASVDSVTASVGPVMAKWPNAARRNLVFVVSGCCVPETKGLDMDTVEVVGCPLQHHSRATLLVFLLQYEDTICPSVIAVVSFLYCMI